MGAKKQSAKKNLLTLLKALDQGPAPDPDDWVPVQYAVPEPAWEATMKSVHTRFGALNATTYTTSLPGASAGAYMVVQFATSFVGKADAVATVTPAKQADGRWRVSGH